ncbi:hypothetical protein Holit_00458 [Hollandina sp. SP2]
MNFTGKVILDEIPRSSTPIHPHCHAPGFEGSRGNNTLVLHIPFPQGIFFGDGKKGSERRKSFSQRQDIPVIQNRQQYGF